MNGNHRTQDLLLGAVFGSAVGALTAMLFTTKKGQQLRKEAANKYQEFQDKLKEMVGSAEEAVEPVVEKMASKLKKGKDENA